jgi:hypothetical protein
MEEMKCRLVFTLVGDAGEERFPIAKGELSEMEELLKKRIEYHLNDGCIIEKQKSHYASITNPNFCNNPSEYCGYRYFISDKKGKYIGD